ncbi:MAG: ABC transporter substrate-binding protein [Candidatus Eremiobacteraeota bacterium]|nr:ABC transporter substrate-binding protein [Candidatus Eremiobacteraeota bacterium]
MPVIAAALLLAAGLRIVSLAPALTEDLYAIGAGNDLVAVDEASNRPAAAQRLPRVGNMQDVNAEAILRLRPDVVIGIPLESAHLADVARAGIRIAVIPMDTLHDDLAAIERLGTLTGRDAQAQRLAAAIRARLAALARQAHSTRTLSAFVSLDGMGTAGGGSFIDQLLSLANLRNVAGRAHDPWLMFSPEELLRAQPDVIVTGDRDTSLTGEPWSRLAAVRAARVLRVPEDDLFRPGPRVADVLADLIAGTQRWR